MAHEKDKAYPWHERSINIGSNQIRSSRTDEEGSDAIPKVKEPNEIKERDPTPGSDGERQRIKHLDVRYYEKILLVGFCVWYPLQDASERVGQEEYSNELDWA